MNVDLARGWIRDQGRTAFPKKVPGQAARGAAALLGRLAGREPAAFMEVVQLKAYHGILRQRVGGEHRRLQPD